MSFWDDVSNFGSGLLEDVGEGMGNLISGATTPVQKDVAANPNTVQQPTQTAADNYGNAVTVPQGAVSQTNSTGLLAGFTDTQLILGVVGVLALIILATRR